MEEFHHLPVMVSEVVELIVPVPSGVVVDATVGGGGHAGAILRARPDLRLLGIDRDPDAVAAAGAALARFGDRVRLEHGGFERVAEIVHNVGSEGTIVAILFDLGVSSPQLDRGARGFSFWAEDAPLDMRMDSAQTLTAHDVVNDYDVDALARDSSLNTAKSASRVALPRRSSRHDRSNTSVSSSKRSSAGFRLRRDVGAVIPHAGPSRRSAWK